jgi:hypothetical protein
MSDPAWNTTVPSRLLVFCMIGPYARSRNNTGTIRTGRTDEYVSPRCGRAKTIAYSVAENARVLGGETFFGPFMNITVLAAYTALFLFMGIRFHTMNQKKE